MLIGQIRPLDYLVYRLVDEAASNCFDLAAVRPVMKLLVGANLAKIRTNRPRERTSWEELLKKC